MSITKSSTFTDPWLPFQLTNVLNDKGNQSQKFFGHLAHFLFFEGGCYVVQSQNLYYQKNTLRNYASLMKTLFLRHYTLYDCCSVFIHSFFIHFFTHLFNVDLKNCLQKVFIFRIIQIFVLLLTKVLKWSLHCLEKNYLQTILENFFQIQSTLIHKKVIRTDIRSKS